MKGIRRPIVLRTAGAAAVAVLGGLLSQGSQAGGSLSAPAATQNPPQQSAESFAAAIFERSMSPFYVLITVVDDTTGKARTGCTTANLLLGAIDMEYGLASDAAGIEKERNIALSTAGHVFHFSKAEALANVAFRYSPHDMDVARQLIRPLSDQQLREGFSDPGALQSTSDATQDARACALIERGLTVRMADRTGRLILVR